MKRFLQVAIALLIGFSLQAQDAKKAKELLDEVSSKVKSYDNIVIDFKYALNNPKENINQESKGGGWYFEQSFDLNFSVEIIDDKYIVTVSDIVFDGEGETNNNNRLENYVLRIGQSKFHTTEKNLINLKCLENYFIKLFQIPGAEITTW